MGSAPELAESPMGSATQLAESPMGSAPELAESPVGTGVARPPSLLLGQHDPMQTVPTALPLRPPAHRVDPRARTWWLLRGLGVAAGIALPQLVVALVLGGPGWLWGTLGATVVVGLVYAAVVPGVLFRIHRWEVTDEAVYTLSGWLVREWRIAPISRVQTVDTEHGPLQQLLGLASVTVTTASARGPVVIRALAAGDAAELARQLTETTQAMPGDAT